MPPDPTPVSQDARTRVIVGAFDLAADIYEGVGVDFFTTFGRWLVEAAALTPGERVLDAGCGRGAVTLPAAEAVGSRGHVTAIDLSPRMVQFLAQDAAARGLDNVDVGIGDAQSPPDAGTPFDCVLAGLVIFLLADPPAALSAYRRLLRPGGRIALSTFGPDDPRWSWMGELRGLVPPDRRTPGGDISDARWKDPEHAVRLLRDGGYVEVATRERERIVRFRDPEQWLAWTRSHGTRMLWELVPPERHGELTRIATEHLHAMRDVDGTIPLRVVLRIATARNP